MNDTKGLVSEIEDLLNGNWFGEASTYINHVDSLLESALTALKAQGWQPISTAPRDGTDVLLWCGWAITGVWVKDNWRTEDKTVPIFMVTHWMPLPSPPSTNELKESHEH